MSLTPLTSRGDILSAALSPDGKFLAFSVRDASSSSIRLNHVPSGTDIALVTEPNVYSHSALEFSPDGNTLYYVRRNRDDGSASIV